MFKLIAEGEIMTMIKLKIICPVCSAEKFLDYPKSIFEKFNEHSTLGFPSGLICEHRFQALIDKDCIIRGYQIIYDNPDNYEDQ